MPMDEQERKALEEAQARAAKAEAQYAEERKAREAEAASRKADEEARKKADEEARKKADGTKPEPNDQDRFKALQEQLERTQAIARNAARRAYLGQLIHEDVARLAPAVELDDDGNLTPESRTTLDNWKKDRPQFFGGTIKSGTPGAQVPFVNSASGGATLTEAEIARVRREDRKRYETAEFQEQVVAFYKNKHRT